MKATKNTINSSKALLRFGFGKTMAGGKCIFIDLYGNSYSCVISKEAADELLLFLDKAKEKVQEWKDKLEYETEKQAGW